MGPRFFRRGRAHQAGSGRQRALLVGGALAAATLVAGVAALVAGRERPAPPTTPTLSTTTAPTTTPTTAATTTTIEDLTTTTIEEITTTTAPTVTPTETRFEVVVVGDGLGGVAAAIAAGRLGIPTLLLSPTGYLGGQAAAAGVATMDEGAGRDLLRQGGLYRELIDHLESVYGSRTMGGCYFSAESVCPEPNVVEEFFREAAAEAGVEIRPLHKVSAVHQVGNRVIGVIADGVLYTSEVLVDATELQEVYPMVNGLRYEYGDSSGCLQDVTWLAIRNWYSGGAPADLTPPQDALSALALIYGQPTVDSWMDHFRSRVGPITEGEVSGLEWPTVSGPWSAQLEASYRALADSRPDLAGAPAVTRTGVNYANDSTFSAGSLAEAALGRHQVVEAEFRRALHVTYAFLWYLRWELGVSEWGVADDLGYERAQRWLWDDLLPDRLEQNLPPMPYIREGRRMQAVANLFGADVAGEMRYTRRFGNPVMFGHYATDSHGCPLAGTFSGDGLFEVPLQVFLPVDVDGFLPGMPRAAGLDRTVASALRTQPDEIWGGQVVGALAGLAARHDLVPRQVAYEDVRQILTDAGWMLSVS